MSDPKPTPREMADKLFERAIYEEKHGTDREAAYYLERAIKWEEKA